ncbi:hypothetical protein [Streptomyces sp. NPDC095817]|uniref:hypothetical protein n=1 Tax=Streptomyces sp. NPDC095817 TaxID=3155082 RepID=UPI00331F581B
MRRILAAVVVASPVLVAACLRVGHWQVDVDRTHITVTPRPRRHCSFCRGAGGCWMGGPFPEMEACGCWSDRRHLRIRIGAAPDPWPEPSF